ncbi:cupredoxin domain-containing protein [Candidatus Peribacteria bacterium]|nr:cupredoxin domain-containing protein [Candidatus Peribacteria bacterium]
MLTGMATFFLPCGFTLAMQMYAISTGSFITGALAMALFALGTAPGLIGIGGLTAFAKGSWAKRFFRFTGVIVLLLGFFNAANAYNLLSLGYGSGQTTQNVDTSKLETEEIRMTQDDSGYSPNIINVKPNSKIRLIVDAKSPYSCSSTIVIPSVGVSKRLVAGENIIEFVSPSSGEVRFSCSMGMYTGKFVVSDSGSSVSANTNVQNQNPGTSGSSARGGGNEKQSTNNGVETIRLAYTSNGLSEQTINVKKGKSYKILIDVKDTVSGCMSRIVIPGLDENIQSLTAGNIVEFNIRPTENGQFPLTCAMGVPHGYINVE